MLDLPDDIHVLGSALKHGFGEAEVIHALENSFVDVSYGKDGTVWAFCGPDSNGNPLEILVDFEKKPPVVFHADRLTISFEKLIKSQLNRNAR